MDYQQQEKFLNTYRLRAIVFALITILVEVLEYLTHSYTFTQIVCNSIVTLILIYAVIYLPKYLHFTIETYKKISWQVRIRWILATILLVSALLVANGYWQYGAAIGSVTILLITNVVARQWLKRQQYNQPQTNHWPISLCYAIGDTIVLYMVFSTLNPNLILQVLMCGIALHFALQLGNFLTPFLFFFLISWSSLFLPILLGIIGVSSYLFLHTTKRQNERNHLETVAELVAFTGKSQSEVAELLITSTTKLAADWYQKQPTTQQEVEAWYCHNAPFYIYDLSQYHLAYKHIVFTLDVINMAHGRVLDYGAGIGDLALALAKKGATVTYFDVEGESKQYAKWQAERQSLALNFASRHAELIPEIFDTIIILDVLEHLFTPLEVLDFLLPRLAPGGVLLVSAYFGATKAHPMHFDHQLDVGKYLNAQGLIDAKGFYWRFLASEAIRRKHMYIYHKPTLSLSPNYMMAE